MCAGCVQLGQRYAVCAALPALPVQFVVVRVALNKVGRKLVLWKECEVVETLMVQIVD